MPLVGRVVLRCAGDRRKRRVDVDHRVIEEERLVLVMLDKIQGVVADDVRPVLPLRVLRYLAVLKDMWVLVARRVVARALGDAVLGEPEPARPRVFVLARELPFADDAGRVARVLGDMAKRPLAPIQSRGQDVVPPVVLAGHEGDA